MSEDLWLRQTWLSESNSSSPSSITITELSNALTPEPFALPRAKNQGFFTRPPPNKPSRPGDTARIGTVLPRKSVQLKWTVILYILTLLLSVALFFYLHAALVSPTFPLGPFLLTPQKTLLLVSILSQILVLLLEFLMTSVLNSLRWQLASRDNGVPVSTFLGLSRATSLWGVITLMCRRTHFIWGTHRILLAALFLFVSVVIKVHITFPYVFSPTDHISVFAGLAPLNITFLELVPPAFLTTFFSWWSLTLLSIPRYVTRIEPVACKYNCTSVFLPGGVEQARLLNRNLNKTLLQGEIFDRANTIIIENAPGYHLEFFPKDPKHEFDVTDCLTFGQSPDQGIFICVAFRESTLIAGWSVCPRSISSSWSCFNNTSWMNPLQQSTSMSAFKRYATVAYERQNFSILSVENISSPESVTYNASDYLRIFSRLLAPQSNNATDPNAVLVKTAIIHLSWVLELYQADYGDDRQSPVNVLRNMLIIPIQFSTALWLFANTTAESISMLAAEGIYALPSDLETTAHAARMIPRVMATPWTIYVFIGVSSALYLWGASILCWVFRQPDVPPITSSFMEVDISSKPMLSNLGGQTGEPVQSSIVDFSSMLQRGEMGNAESSHIAKSIKGKRIQVRALQDRVRDERHIVLVTLDEDATGSHDIERRGNELGPLVPGKAY